MGIAIVILFVVLVLAGSQGTKNDKRASARAHRNGQRARTRRTHF